MVRLNRVLLLCGALCAACSSGTNEPATHTLYGRYDASQGLPELAAHRDRGGSDDLYLVQFSRAIGAPQRAAVRSAGARLVRYYPDDGFVVRASTAQSEALSQIDGVHTVQIFPDKLRLHPALLVDGDLDTGSSVLTSVTVEVHSVDAVPQVLKDIQSMGGQVLRAPITGRVVRAALTPAQIQTLLGNLDVEAVEPFTPVHSHNALEYGLLQAGEPNVSPLWNVGIDGNKQIVAIADGALVNPSDSCRLETGNGYTKILKYVTLDTNVTPTDPNTYLHATHVAGILAGDNKNNGIYDDQDGMAPAAEIYFQEMGDNLAGLPADLNDLFAPAYAYGAFIHSNSWGGGTAYDAQARAVDAFVYKNPTYLIIFSAGNDGNTTGTVEDPALAKNALAVGSMDNLNDISYFSSQGPTADGRIKPDLVASGNDVLSAAWSSNLSSPPPGDGTCGTTALTGTSMAAPNIAGAAALVRQYYNQGYYPSGNANTSNVSNYPSAALIRATLVASGVNMIGNYTSGDFPSSGQGFGRAQLDTALYLNNGTTQRLFAADDTTGLTTGGTRRYTFHVQYDTPVKFVLVWNDAEASATASKQLVNNLDLTVTDPCNRTFRGNAMLDGNSEDGGAADSNNNTEMVYLSSAPVGTYTVTVTGTSVPGDSAVGDTGAQLFALVGVGSFQASDLTILTNTTSAPSGSGASGGASGSGGGGGSGAGYDPESGASATGQGGIIDKGGGCAAVPPNSALLVLLVGLWFILPKPPRRKRARVRVKR